MLCKPAMALSAGFVFVLVAQASPTAEAGQDGRKYKMLTAPLVLSKLSGNARIGWPQPGALKLQSTAGKRSRAITRYYSGPVSRFSQGQRTRW
jgi:hypothetical protein